MPRQRNAAELSCCRLVTLVTVAVQQDPASLTPEAPAEQQTIRGPLSKPGLLLFFSVLFLRLHLLPDIYTKKLTPTLKLHLSAVMH